MQDGFRSSSRAQRVSDRRRVIPPAAGLFGVTAVPKGPMNLKMVQSFLTIARRFMNLSELCRISGDSKKALLLRVASIHIN
jgi:hypothetical protein